MTASRILRLAASALCLCLSPVLSGAGGDLTQAMPYAQGARRMVLEQLEQILSADSSLQIVGQGSWLRGPASGAGKLSRSYADPLLGGTSDHDLRLVLQGEDGPVLSRWKAVRERLAAGLDGIFRGKSIEEIERLLVKNYGYTAEQAAAIARRGGSELAQVLLRSVNLYPPPQVMRGVVNDRTARALFQKAGAVPSLAGRLVEGVWGEGAESMIQAFESQGRVFYSSAGKVRAGFTDLVHLSEGYGRHTMGGYANMAYQWAEKAAEAIHERDADAAAKYLARLKNNLERARAKGNLPAGVLDDALRELDVLISQARAGGALLENPQVASLLRQARLNSRLLGELARNPGPMDRQVIEAILGGQRGPLSSFGGAMREAWAKADNWVLFERGLQGVFLAWSVMGVSDTWGEKGMEQALRQAGADVAFFATAVPGLMATMTNMVLDSAKDAGYELAVSPQHYDDFLAGISSVKGYQGETGINVSIEALATDFCTRGEIERLVERQALAISQLKETGAPEESQATTDSREAIRAALVRKMTPIVYREWLRVRKVRLMRALDRLLSLDDLMNQIVLRAAPAVVVLEEGQASATAELALGADSDWAPVEQALAAISAEVQALGGRNPMATGLSHPVQCDHRVSVTWKHGGHRQEVSSRGKIADALSLQPFSFAAAGTQLVEAEFRLEVQVFVGGGADVARDVMDARPLLVRNYRRVLPVSVEVVRIARVKPTGPRPSPVAAPGKVAAGEVFTVRLNRSRHPEIRPGSHRPMLVQPGKKLSFEDAALLQFDPSGSMRPSGVRDLVSVLAERSTPEGLEMDLQVRQVEGYERAEALELAWVGVEDKGSLSGELARAQEDLERANREMEESIARMTPEQIEQMQAKMDEALARAEAGELPRPETALPPPPMFTVPILVRPAQVHWDPPEGWVEDTSGAGPRRSFHRREGDGRPGAVVNLQAAWQVSLMDAVADHSNGNMAADLALANRDRPGARVLPVQGKDGYAGELVTRETLPAPEEDTWRYVQEGGAILRRGDVFMRVLYNAEVEGYRRVERNADGTETVAYDTREAAAAAYAGLTRQIDAAIRSLGVVAKVSADEPAPPATGASGSGEVRLEAPKLQGAPGEWIEVACVVDDPRPGDAPYTYDWSGNHAGSGDKVTFLASEPGKYDLAVIVRSAAGTVVGSASITLQVQ